MSFIYLETLNIEWGQIDPKGKRRVNVSLKKLRGSLLTASALNICWRTPAPNARVIVIDMNVRRQTVSRRCKPVKPKRITSNHASRTKRSRVRRAERRPRPDAAAAPRVGGLRRFLFLRRGKGSPHKELFSSRGPQPARRPLQKFVEDK